MDETDPDETDPDETDPEWTVGELARLAGVSVRTLHHYDDVELLRPTGRSPAGYRLYDTADRQRLQQILFYRELGFGLEEIRHILAEPDRDAEHHLRRQQRLLREQIARRQSMLAAVEKELEALRMGIPLTPQEQFEVFGTDQVGGEWADEAEQRWGDTDAYRESQRRMAAYTKQDWLEVKSQSDAALRAFAGAMASGQPADGPVARQLAEGQRQFLNRWFYDCDHEMHRGLAEIYVSDERFTATFDSVAPGLARYVHDAIIANAASAQGE